jgi:hypothetical protein
MRKQASVALFMAGCLILGLAFATAAEDTEFAVATWKQGTAPAAATSAGDSAPKFDIARVTGQKNGLKLVLETVDSKGTVTRAEYEGKWNGKDYPVTGLPDSDAISLSKLDGYTIDCAYKKSGKVVRNERIILSKDGKRATVFRLGRDRSGLDATVIAVWDRQ